MLPSKISSVGQIHMYASQVFKEKESPECIVTGTVKKKKSSKMAEKAKGDYK